MIVTESFKVHLSEADIYFLDDAYAEGLLESEDSCDYDEQGVFVWVSVEVGPAAPTPPVARPRERVLDWAGYLLLCLVFCAVTALLGKWSQ